MRFSILHISDLHRDLTDEINNEWLLDSLENDLHHFETQSPEILRPSLSIVSGDLIYGTKLGITDSVAEQKRQYSQAEEFLVGLADRFFGGMRDRVVLSPGNHDVFYDEVMASANKIDIPPEPHKKAALTEELFRRNSRLRWSWRELCFYKIVDGIRYENRLQHFADTYNRFYKGLRSFSLQPEEQFEIFDFPELNFSVVALNSCFDNDPLRRAGGFNATALASACRKVRHPERTGRLKAATWHHNLAGGPASDDYLEPGFLQLLIDAGVSLGFHGHQHLPECFDERYRIGPSPRKITIISASTLCAGPNYLKPGVPRSYNIVELDTDRWVGRVHQRHMVNAMFDLPVWGPGHFTSTNGSYLDFELCKPPQLRPSHLDLQLALSRADELIGARHWEQALNVLDGMQAAPLARPLLLRVLSELGDDRKIIEMLWPPESVGEIVTLGGAIIGSGTKQEVSVFLNLPIVAASTDASVQDITRRIKERRLR